MKTFFGKYANRLYASALAALSVFMFGAMGLLAESGGGAVGYDMTEAIGSAMSDLQTQANSILTVVVPAVLVITVAIIGINFGMKLFKRLTGSAG